MPFANALSEHPLATQATGEVVGSVLEQLGPRPDLALVFVTGPHRGALEDIVATIRATLEPGTVLGVAAVSVLGGPREVEEQAAISLWAARVAPALPVRLVSRAVDGTYQFSGLPESASIPGSTLILVGDPGSFPSEVFLDAAAAQLPDLTVIGGQASAVPPPATNRLVLDGEVHAGGAAGVLLGPEWPVTTVVSQGCRPIGEPYTVTRAERSMVYEIAGAPAFDRLRQVVAGLSPDDRSLARQGVHLGRVIDEHEVDPGPGDFLVRNVIGGDPDNGALAVGDVVEVGSTVQFQVRDATSADADLRDLLTGALGRGALVFTCNGRGSRLFGEPDHDAGLVSAVVGPAVSGMFCAGEIGPVGTRSFVHGFTASVALFDDPA